MSETIFTKIDRYAPEMRSFAEAVVRDVDHALTVEGLHLGRDAYLVRFQRFCRTRESEWQVIEDRDYRLDGEIDGDAARVRRNYYTLAEWCNRVYSVC